MSVSISRNKVLIISKFCLGNFQQKALIISILLRLRMSAYAYALRTSLLIQFGYWLQSEISVNGIQIYDLYDSDANALQLNIYEVTLNKREHIPLSG